VFKTRRLCTQTVANGGAAMECIHARHVPLPVVVNRVEVITVIGLKLSPEDVRHPRVLACDAPRTLLPPQAVPRVRDSVDHVVLKPIGQRRCKKGGVVRQDSLKSCNQITRARRDR
jgi:hypothetical protein